MPDGGAWRTCADTDATQTEVQRRITGCHQAQPEKGRAWPTHAPNSRELPGAWAPRADLRRPTRPNLAVVRMEEDGECGWGARVSQKSTRKSGENKNSTTLEVGRKLTPLNQLRGEQKTPWLTRSQRKITTKRGRREATPFGWKPCSQGRGSRRERREK
jgi:hypothetical protein